MAYKARSTRSRAAPRYSARRGVSRKPAARSRRASSPSRRAPASQTLKIVLVTGGEQSVSPFNRQVPAKAPARSKF